MDAEAMKTMMKTSGDVFVDARPRLGMAAKKPLPPSRALVRPPTVVTTPTLAGPRWRAPLVIRAVHGSIRVEFVPNPEPSRRNWVGKKCTHRQPAGVIESDGSDHQRVAGRLVEVIDLRTQRENDEKNIDPAKKPRFR